MVVLSTVSDIIGSQGANIIDFFTHPIYHLTDLCVTFANTSVKSVDKDYPLCCRQYGSTFIHVKQQAQEYASENSELKFNVVQVIQGHQNCFRPPSTPLIRHSRYTVLYKLQWVNEWMNEWMNEWKGIARIDPLGVAPMKFGDAN